MHELVLSLGSLYLTYLHSLFELQVAVDEDDAAGLQIDTHAAAAVDAYAPANGAAAALPLPSPTHSAHASSSAAGHRHAQNSIASPRSGPSPAASRAGLFRSRSVQSPAGHAPSAASPAASASSPAPASMHSVSETYESLRMQSPGSKVPRYMMHSKSFSCKVKGKAGGKGAE